MSNNTNEPFIYTLEDPVEYLIDNVCMVTRSDCIRIDGPTIPAEVLVANLKSPVPGAEYSVEDPIEYHTAQAPQSPLKSNH